MISSSCSSLTRSESTPPNRSCLLALVTELKRIQMGLLEKTFNSTRLT